MFLVRSAYIILQNSLSVENISMFNSFLIIKIILNAQYFGWEVILNKISTKVILVWRDVSLGTSLCDLCNEYKITSYIYFSVVK